MIDVPAVESVPEPTQLHVPEKQEPKPEPKPTNGKKRATVHTAQWTEAATAFAASCPYYQKDGAPDFYRMLGAAAKCHVVAVTDANLPQVLDLLRSHAEEQKRAAQVEAGQQEMTL